MNGAYGSNVEERPVRVSADTVMLEGNLGVPDSAQGVVLFAHGSGSGRHSPRNRYVAKALREAGLATVLIDLLTPEEEEVDLRTRHLRFDIGLLAERLVGATDWLAQQPQTQSLRVGYFGSSTGGGAALVAAAPRPQAAGAVVSRGGRPRPPRGAPAPRPRPDAAHRRRRRRAGDRDEPGGARADDRLRREAPGDR